MARRVERTTIARSPADVWAVLAEFGDISAWATNVDHSCLTTEQVNGVGAVRRIQTGRNALLERIVEWEPSKRLGYTIEGLPPVIRSVVNTWNLEPAGEGTEVTITSTIDAGPRPPQKLVAKAAGRLLARASTQMLEGLHTQLMQSPGALTKETPT